MNQSANFEKEEKTFTDRQITHLMTGIGGMVIGFGGAGVAALNHGNTRIAGIIAAVLGTVAVVSAVGEHMTDYIDLEARKSASNLLSNLENHGVVVTPEQKTSLQQDEYAKAKKEWTEKIIDETFAEVAEASEVHL
jgi:hypothetical protein